MKRYNAIGPVKFFLPLMTLCLTSWQVFALGGLPLTIDKNQTVVLADSVESIDSLSKHALKRPKLYDSFEVNSAPDGYSILAAGSSLTAEVISGLSVWRSVPKHGEIDVYGGYVVKLEPNGTGFEYPVDLPIGEDLDLLADDTLELKRIPLTWNITTDGVVRVLLFSSEHTATVNTAEEIREFGFDYTVVNFLEDAINNGDWTGSDAEVNREITQKRIKGVSEKSGLWNVKIFEVGEYEIDELLISLGWTGELPRVAANEYDVINILDVEATVKGNEEKPFASEGDQLVFNYIVEPNADTVAAESKIEALGADLLVLNSSGTTTQSLLSGNVFEWQHLNDGSLLLDDGDNRYILTNISRNGGAGDAITTIMRDGKPTYYFAGRMAINGDDQEFFIHDLTSLTIPSYWQTHLALGSRDTYFKDGRIGINYLLGYTFYPDGEHATLFGWNYPDCTEPEWLEGTCFFRDARDFQWTSAGNQINMLTTETTFSSGRHRIWEVLNYDLSSYTATVLEWRLYEREEDGQDVWAWWYAPRINIIKPYNLELYPEELERALESGFFEF